QPAPHDANTPPPPEGTIVVQVGWTGKDKQPSLRINQEDVSWENLKPRLNDIYKLRSQKIAFVKGDDDIAFEYVAKVIDLAKAIGVERVALIARSQADQ